jgi:hypothetical protein
MIASRRRLHVTVQQVLAEATTLLLHYGADPNAQSEHFHQEIICALSPLHVAAWPTLSWRASWWIMALISISQTVSMKARRLSGRNGTTSIRLPSS